MINLWSILKFDASDLRDLKMKIGMLVASIAVVTAIFVLQFHIVYKYKIGSYLTSKLSGLLSSSLDALLNQNSSYIGNHFFDVSRAAEIYDKYFLKYASELFSNMNVQEINMQIFTKVQIWFTEFLVIFFLCAIIWKWV